VRVILYTGKGGVGKTTTAAATAACAAARGRRVLVASADAAHSLGDVFELRLGAAPRAIRLPRGGRGAGGLSAVEVDARIEMDRHWGKVRDYLVSIFRYQGIEEVVAEELALLPGVEELAALLAVEEHARSGRFDLVVVDCAPTDSALRLLTLPEVAHGALRALLRVQQAIAAAVTPLARALVNVPLPASEVFADADRLIHRKLRELRARVCDPETSVRLVLTQERMVIDEARRAYTDLGLFEIACDAVVMNRLLPAEAAAEPFFRDWARVQDERHREVEAHFAPLPVIGAALREDEVLGVERLLRHGEELFAEREPDAVLCRSPGLRFAEEAGGFEVEVPLPGASRDALEVAVVDRDLVVRCGARRRAVELPRRIAALPLAGAQLVRDRLVVRFGPAPPPPPPPQRSRSARRGRSSVAGGPR
jgi:arsenite-transporting ATPase